jgi:hypothetical protein
MAKPKKKDKSGKRERRERRFLPQASTNPTLVRALYALGAAALGAGTWGLVGKQWMTNAPEGIPYAAWVAAAGFVLLGAAVWLGTTGDAAVRVGDPGIAQEKGDLKRIPWSGVESIAWEEGTESLVVSGKLEGGGSLTFKIRRKVHADAIAWILKEARERAEELVDVPESVTESLPKASQHSGQVIKLDPMQLVGRRCAESDEVIAYEPDARVCGRCERVYHKAHVPKKCACGANLAALRKKSGEPAEEANEAEDAGAEDTEAHEGPAGPLADERNTG